MPNDTIQPTTKMYLWEASPTPMPRTNNWWPASRHPSSGSETPPTIGHLVQRIDRAANRFINVSSNPSPLRASQRQTQPLPTKWFRSSQTFVAQNEIRDRMQKTSEFNRD
jgi:hypothetical protein